MVPMGAQPIAVRWAARLSSALMAAPQNAQSLSAACQQALASIGGAAH
jgi:hypothetical protein